MPQYIKAIWSRWIWQGASIEQCIDASIRHGRPQSLSKYCWSPTCQMINKIWLCICFWVHRKVLKQPSMGQVYCDTCNDTCVSSDTLPTDLCAFNSPRFEWLLSYAMVANSDIFVTTLEHSSCDRLDSVIVQKRIWTYQGDEANSTHQFNTWKQYICQSEILKSENCKQNINQSEHCKKNIHQS